MKTKLAAVGIVLLLGAILAGAESPKTTPGKDLMRKKLQHAQGVLEGITLQNFKLIAANAAKLGALSHEPVWRASEAVEYAEQSAAFRRSVEALKTAARDRNLEAATLAYSALTLNCVECHKFMRGRKVAERPDRRSPGPVVW